MGPPARHPAVKKPRSWLLVALAVVAALVSVAALAQRLEPEDEERIGRQIDEVMRLPDNDARKVAIQQQVMDMFEVSLRDAQAAQAAGDCTAFRKTLAIYQGLDLRRWPERLTPEWFDAWTSRFNAMKAGGCPLNSATDANAPQVPLCPTQYNAILERTAGVCRCDRVSGSGSVWGTYMYTSDSNICHAAVHSGAISREGGVVKVSLELGLLRYDGSTQNGITTQDWGNWDASFQVERASPPYPLVRPLALVMPPTFLPPADAIPQCPPRLQGNESRLAQPCRCPDGGRTYETVWGSGPYTSDSAICRAALHAGMITAAGGLVHVVAEPGLERYSGSTRNEVTTQGWSASFPGSFGFAPVAAGQ